MLLFQTCAIFLIQFLCLTQGEMPLLPAMLEVRVEDSKGEVVLGLTEERFEVKCGDRPCPFRLVPTTDLPYTVGILVDTSASMRPRLFQDSRTLPNAIEAFLEQSNPQNSYFVLEFGEKLTLRQDYTQDRTKVLAALPQNAHGGTSLFSALSMGLKKLADRQGSKALLIVSDGWDMRDNESQLSEITQSVEAPIFGLCPFDFEDAEAGRSHVARICEASGGSFQADIRLARAAAKIGRLLRNVYRLQIECPIRGCQMKVAIGKFKGEGRTNALFPRRPVATK